jgi:TPR repeat protein
MQVFLCVLIFCSIPIYANASESGLGSHYLQLERLHLDNIPVLEERSQAGDSEASTLLGDAYALGFAGLPLDVARAHEFFTKAISQGSHWAIQEDSRLLYRNMSNPFIQAASRIKMEAQDVIEEHNSTQAAQIITPLSRMASLGDTEAALILAHITNKGLGTPQDDKEAFRLYSQAATADYPSAHAALAHMFSLGLGTDANQILAAIHHLKAAMGGIEASMVPSGAACLMGLGMPKNEIEALAWFEAAAMRGDDRGLDAMDQLRASMKTEDILKAETMAQERAQKSIEFERMGNFL